MTVPTLQLISLSCKSCEDEIEGRKTFYLNADTPSNSYVIKFGTWDHTSMVSTTRHGVPHDAAEESEESEEEITGAGKGFALLRIPGFRRPGATEIEYHRAFKNGSWNL